MDLIQEILDEVSCSYNESKLVQLNNYFSLLNTWTKKIDLISEAPINTQIKAHLPDAIFHYLESVGNTNVLDIGSGAGLPAIPCAILAPDTRFTLCEPREKRVIFLKEMKRRLSLDNLIVQRTRLEDFKLEELFDGATARAILRDEPLLKALHPLLKPDSTLRSSSNGVPPSKLTTYLQFVEIKERTIRGKKLFLEVLRKT